MKIVTVTLEDRARRLLQPTERQRAVLRLIEAGRRENGYPPTIRELADQLKVTSTQAVACHLGSLKRKGFVDWAEGKGRTLSVTKRGRAWLPLEVP